MGAGRTFVKFTSSFSYLISDTRKTTHPKHRHRFCTQCAQKTLNTWAWLKKRKQAFWRWPAGGRSGGGRSAGLDRSGLRAVRGDSVARRDRLVAAHYRDAHAAARALQRVGARRHVAHARRPSLANSAHALRVGTVSRRVCRYVHATRTASRTWNADAAVAFGRCACVPSLCTRATYHTMPCSMLVE